MMLARQLKNICVLTLILVTQFHVSACIWDSDTLSTEKKRHPDMAKLILENTPPAPPVAKLNARISELRSNPRENDPVWWNDLAGAYLRMGKPSEAAGLLEPLLNTFPNDYGIHANLGTAYHLLGRYQLAAKHIKRDLEINTNAHFGLEVFHLALLQYLSRDKQYQQRHVYVDEFTSAFLAGDMHHRVIPEKGLADPDVERTKTTSSITRTADTTDAEWELKQLLQAAKLDPSPPYRFEWNLAEHPKLEEGVRYMAELNPSEPACYVMLGLLCLNNHDLNLGVAAFERAARLGSIQASVLRIHIQEIKSYISESRKYGGGIRAVARILIGFGVAT